MTEFETKDDNELDQVSGGVVLVDENGNYYVVDNAIDPYFQEKAKSCESLEDLEQLCSSLGLKISDEALEKISGGFAGRDCPSKVTLCRLL